MVHHHRHRESGITTGLHIRLWFQTEIYIQTRKPRNGNETKREKERRSGTTFKISKGGLSSGHIKEEIFTFSLSCS